MIGLPAAAAASKPSIRRDEKQGREFEGSGAVRVFSVDGYFVTRLSSLKDSEQIRRLLRAPNAEAVRKHDGKLVGIKLLSFGDDRGDSGERHGRSTVTTERVRNDRGALVGSDLNLKHKERTCNTWGTPAVTVRPRSLNEGFASAPQRRRPGLLAGTGDKRLKT